MLPPMQTLLQDLRYAVRQLRKNPGFTTVVVLAVALGIGANTAMFSVVNGFVRPLPVRAPEQLLVLAARVKGDDFGLLYRVSYPALQDLKKQADVFSDLFGYDTWLAGLSADGRAGQFFCSLVTGNYFSALGLKPAAGRLFVPGEGEQARADLTLVLGHSYWVRRFGGDPAVIGKQVRINGKPATVVGVAPRDFRGLYAGAEMDGYLTLAAMGGLILSPAWDFSGLFTDRDTRRLTVFARLKPGVTLAQAQTSADVIAQRLAEQYPATDKDIGLRVVPETLARPMPIPLMAKATPVVSNLFLVLAALVLLVACMNVANLLLVRATLRRREMAIRAAIGSGRARLIRQMLTESLLLAFLGGIAGLILAMWASDALSSMQWAETSLPVRLDFSFDWRVFAYAFAGAVLTGILAGIWPAFRGSRADVSAVLHDGGRSDTGGAGRHRVRSALVVAQVAGSLVLLLAAGLFVRQLQQAQRMDLGFEADHVLNVTMDPHYIGYDRTRAKNFYRELETRARALPGVESAALAYSVPMGYWNDGHLVRIEGHPLSPGQRPPLVLFNRIDPAYFETMQIPILRGRAFRDSDDEKAPLVAIVNETMASRYWPNEDPIGKRFSTKAAGGPFLQVVGVARDCKYMVVFEPRLPYFYVPFPQDDATLRVLQIRSAVPPQLLATQVQRVIQALDPEMPISDVRTMTESLAGAMGFMMFRFGAWLAGAMGTLGLALAVVGVYGVVSFAANQRTREIGIRMALGADARDVLGLVLRQGVRLVIAGVVAGLAIALALTRVTARFMLFVSATDPRAFAGVTLLLAAVALWACYLPARRAMRLDPMAALHHE